MISFYGIIFSIGFLAFSMSAERESIVSKLQRTIAGEEQQIGPTDHHLKLKRDCIPAMGACPLVATTTSSQQCCFPYRCEQQSASSSVTSGKCVNGAVHSLANENSEKCPHLNSLEQILEPVREGEEFERTVRSYEVAKERYVHAAAYRGDSGNNYLLSVRELNLDARAHYAKTVQEIGNNVYPLIIAREVDVESGLSGLGGTYTLYLRDGSSKTIRPTSEEYEIRKGLSHVPIGLFSVVAPYFLTPGGPQLTSSFASFYKKVCATYDAAQVVEPLRISAELRDQGLVMLNITKRHMELWARRSSVNSVAFEQYSAEMFPYIEANIREAASLQANAVYPALAAWKAELGNDWRRVHALIPAIWPVSTINPKLQILSKLMKPEQIRNQVFILESSGSTKSLRGILGKIVGDRAAALLIFGTKAKAQKEFTFNLSGRQDLLSGAAEEALNTLLTHKKIIN